MNTGRPKIINNHILQKLEWAFKLGATDREACNEAVISPQTLYNYQAKNPDFLEQKDAWKSSPIFKARKTVVEHLETDPNLALKYLEKKLPEEFGKRVVAEVIQGNPATMSPEDLAAWIEARNAKIWARNDALNEEEDTHE